MRLIPIVLRVCLKMDNLKGKIISNWDNYFRGEDVETALKKREIAGGFKLQVLYSRFKEEFYKKRKEFSAEEKSDNNKSPFKKVFDNPEKYCALEHNGFLIYPNTLPSEKYHIMLLSSEARPEIKKEDILKLMNFARDTGYTIFLSITGSGATAPGIFHAQGHLEPFPIFSEKGGAKFQKINLDADFSVYRITYPARGIKIVGDKKSYEKIAERLEKIQKDTPFNLLTRGNELLIFPRTKEVPSMFDSWQMGGLEMGGKFCTRAYEVFSSLDYETLKQALSEVTFSEEQLKDFEKRLVGGLND